MSCRRIDEETLKVKENLIKHISNHSFINEHHNTPDITSDTPKTRWNGKRFLEVLEEVAEELERPTVFVRSISLSKSWEGEYLFRKL